MMTTDSSNSADLPDDVMRVAQHWVVTLNSGRVSEADIDALARWRAASQVHRRAFAEANLRWDTARMAAMNLVEAGVGIEAPSAKRRPSRRTVLAGMMATAAGAAYLTIDPPLGLWPSVSELSADYRTGTGEQRRLALAGDVSVELNTRSSMSIGTARQIELIAGEIAVTTGATPLVAIAGKGRIVASAAAFNLRRDGNRVSVSCLQGTVQVTCGGAVAKLSSSQQIVYDERGLSGIGAMNPAVVGAWQQGLLVFEGQPLSQAVDEINRYRRGRIVLLNPELGRLPLDATFRLDRIEQVVPKIAHVFHATVQSLPGGIVLLS